MTTAQTTGRMILRCLKNLLSEELAVVGVGIVPEIYSQIFTFLMSNNK